MKKTYFIIAAFAVFGAVIITTSAVAQPITVKISGQMETINKYGILNTQIDQYLKRVKEFGKKLAKDKEINSNLKKLKEDTTLLSLMDKLENALTDDKINSCGENYENYLKNTEEYLIITDIITTKYSADLQAMEEDALALFNDLQEGLVSDSELFSYLNMILEENEPKTKTISEEDYEEITSEIDDPPVEPLCLRKVTRRIIFFIGMITGVMVNICAIIGSILLFVATVLLIYGIAMALYLIIVFIVNYIHFNINPVSVVQRIKKQWTMFFYLKKFFSNIVHS